MTSCRGAGIAQAFVVLFELGLVVVPIVAIDVDEATGRNFPAPLALGLDVRLVVAHRVEPTGTAFELIVDDAEMRDAVPATAERVGPDAVRHPAAIAGGELGSIHGRMIRIFDSGVKNLTATRRRVDY